MHVQREKENVRLNCGATSTNIHVGRLLVLRLRTRHAENSRILENIPKQKQVNRDVLDACIYVQVVILRCVFRPPLRFRISRGGPNAQA